MAELSLAILPLVISALEHYHAVSKLIKRFKKFDIKFKELQVDLYTQRTIFRNEVRLLFAHAFSPSVSRDMFSDIDNGMWTDKASERQLVDYLQDSFDAFQNIFQSLNALLAKMQYESQELKRKNREASKSGNFSFKSCSQAFVGKMKFLLSDSLLEAQMVNLRQMNQTLHTLVDQIRNHDRLDKEHPINTKDQNSASIADIELSKTIQRTSHLLHQSLGAACSRHIRHDVYFNLKPAIEIKSNVQINFDVGYRHPSLSEQSSMERTRWFSIKSSFTQGNLVSQPAIQKDYVSTPESVIDGRGLLLSIKSSNIVGPRSLPDTSKRGRETQRIDLSSPQKKRKPEQAKDSNTLPTWTSIDESHILPNLLEPPDLCKRIFHGSQDPCLGHLKKDPSCNLIVYMASQPNIRDSASLLDILKICKAQRHLTRIPHVERARFAKLLATAAFQFGNTPWLKREAWRSSDIILCSSHCGTNSLINKLSNPYVDVSIGSDQSQNITPMCSLGHRLISNQLLFGLALMLVEIAFEQPLNELEHEIDRKKSSSPSDTEWATVRRMTRVVQGEMGPHYRRVIENCLNFGLLGADFDGEDFSRRYHTNVICELTELEQMFSGMDLNE